MGIYDAGPRLDFLEGKAWIPVAAALALLALLLLFFASQGAFAPTALSLKLKDNPIKPDGSTLLIVKVSNPTGKDAANVVVKAEARDKASIDVSPRTKRTVGTLEANAVKELEFDVNLIGSVLPGTYKIDVTTIVNGEKFAAEVTLEVKG